MTPLLPLTLNVIVAFLRASCLKTLVKLFQGREEAVNLREKLVVSPVASLTSTWLFVSAAYSIDFTEFWKRFSLLGADG